MLLQELQKPFATPLSKVEKRIMNTLYQGVKTDMKRLLDLAPIRGGKKIRSTFLFILFRDKGAAVPDEAIDLAAAIEMLHQASLIHDDVLDHAQTRRDQPTLHAQVDNTMAVLVGDYLFVKALILARDLNRPVLMAPMLEATQDLVFGQLADMRPAQDAEMTFERYLETLELKTGALFGLAAEMATLFKGGDPAQARSLRQFGRRFGLLFQLTDDMMDLFSNQTGKDSWGDLREGKWTLPTLILRDKVPNLPLFPFSEELVPQLEAELEKHKIRAECERVLHRHRNQVEAEIMRLFAPMTARVLLEVVDYVCRRER